MEENMEMSFIDFDGFKYVLALDKNKIRVFFLRMFRLKAEIIFQKQLFSNFYNML